MLTVSHWQPLHESRSIMSGPHQCLLKDQACSVHISDNKEYTFYTSLLLRMGPISGHIEAVVPSRSNESEILGCTQHSDN